LLPVAPGSRGALSLYVYPRKGQTAKQTANDRYQCHQWAVGQTGRGLLTFAVALGGNR
jgi:hypothetical protein